MFYTRNDQFSAYQGKSEGKKSTIPMPMSTHVGLTAVSGLFEWGGATPYRKMRWTIGMTPLV